MAIAIVSLLALSLLPLACSSIEHIDHDLAALRTEEALAEAVFRDPDASPDERAADLLRRMTTTEKLGQMTLVGRSFLTHPRDIAKYHFGALLSGGGSSPDPNTPESWARMITGFQRIATSTPLGIPLLYGSDAVHGHGNLLNATIFPHHIGLGATNDPDVVRRAAEVTARELMATGVNWNFSPAISVPQDIRWGRTYEGFSSDPAIVSALGAAEIRGLQEAGLPMLATAKHFVADGGTSRGRDRGDSVIDEDTLERVHLFPYHDALESDVAVIMISYSSLNSLKMHAHKELIDGRLKGQMNFEGFVVSDWDALEELGGELIEQVERGINAGIDMVMVPDEYVEFLGALSQAVEEERIPMERIDDSVYRILRVKFAHGVFDDPLSDPELVEAVRSDAHREVAREAVAKSLVLLKNNRRALPLGARVRRIAVVGDRSDDIGAMSGGWTIEWQGLLGSITEGTTILGAIQERAAAENIASAAGGGTDKIVVDYAPSIADVEALVEAGASYDKVIVTIGETPYAEGVGDNQFPLAHPSHGRLVNASRQLGGEVITIVVSGRPLVLQSVLDDSDAVVAAWLPGTEGAGISDVLWGDRPFSGKLPYAWPTNAQSFVHGRGEPLFERGFGLSY